MAAVWGVMLENSSCMRARAAGASADVWRLTRAFSEVGAAKTRGEKEAARAKVVKENFILNALECDCGFGGDG